MGDLPVPEASSSAARSASQVDHTKPGGGASSTCQHSSAIMPNGEALPTCPWVPSSSCGHRILMSTASLRIAAPELWTVEEGCTSRALVPRESCSTVMHEAIFEQLMLVGL